MLDHESIRASAALCHELFGELIQFDLRNGPLRKKFDGVKYDVRKIDDILYELSLVGVNESSSTGTDRVAVASKGVVENQEGGEEPARKCLRGDEDSERGTGIGQEDSGDILDKGEFAAIREAMIAFDEQRCDISY